ncbi:MAG: hypothetical protein ACTSR8_19515 [Promethearchaeota archaeon]
MPEKFLVISYFDPIIGPKILYSKDNVSKIDEFPDLTRILEFQESGGTFLFSFRKFQTVNYIFYQPSEIARGGKDLLMISCIIRASYFKNELIDIFKYLEEKGPILEGFGKKLNRLVKFNHVLHKYQSSSDCSDFSDYCEKAGISFNPLYEKYFNRIFPEAEIRIITRDLDVRNKIYVIGPKKVGKTTFLRSVEALQFYSSQEEFTIPKRILSVLIDNLVALNTEDFIEGNYNFNTAEAYILLFRNEGMIPLKEIKRFLNVIKSLIKEDDKEKISIALIENIINEADVLGYEFIEKEINFEDLQVNNIVLKYWGFDVFEEDKKILDPLRWLIREII